jgi:hypothetical protein
MDSAAIAAALAGIFGGVTAPGDEPAIALATHEIPDELKQAELPALLVWPPDESIQTASRLDRSLQTWPSILYLARAGRTTQARVAALYAWRDVLRLAVETTHTQLGVAGVAQAQTARVVLNAPEDVTFGLVDYDTVRVEVTVKVAEGFVPVA